MISGLLQRAQCDPTMSPVYALRVSAGGGADDRIEVAPQLIPQI
jgi:hypothetical protein